MSTLLQLPLKLVLFFFMSTPLLTLGGWETYEYADHGFNINFPKEPAVQPGEHFDQLTAGLLGTAYQVMYLNTDLDLSGDTKESYYNQAIGMYGGVEEGSREKVSKDGLEGVQTKIKVNNMFGILQVYLSDTRIYILAVLKEKTYPLELSANKFFKSFAYTGTTGTVSNQADNAGESVSEDQYEDNGFDPYEYFKPKSFPWFDNLKDVSAWKDYSMLNQMVKIDISDIEQKIKTYGKDNLSTSYAGKEAMKFMEQLPEIYELMPKVIDMYINEPVNDNRKFGKPELHILKMVQELAHDFYTTAGTEETKKAYEKATKTYHDKIKSSPFIKSTFHQDHMSEVVLFNEEFITDEKEESITNTISPAQGKYVKAFFPLPLSSSKNYVGLLLKSDQTVTFYQKLFVWESEQDKLLGENAAIGVNFFPNPESLNYKSGYEYDVHINLLSFLLLHPNGTHDIEIGFTTDYMANTTPQVGYSTFRLHMTDKLKKDIESLKKSLIDKRIQATVMPDHCVDNSSVISNKDGFAKYGKLLKYVQTVEVGAVKDSKWPHPVIAHATGGWAAIERPSGEIELIPIGLFRKIGTSNWKFTAISTIPPDFELRGDQNYFDGRGEFGYIMLPENVSKCHSWE